MDQIIRLRIFALLAETLSFTSTAKTMGLARSSVTKAMNELERELGTRLLDRTTRSARLTPDGEAFRIRCLAALGSFDDACAMFSGDAVRPSGRVRASVPSRLGRRLIAPSLPDFFARYPGVQLELSVSDRQADLVREGFDCVLRFGEKADSELVARKLADVQLVTCASPAYLERHGVPRTIADLGSHLAIGYASPFTGRVETWHGVVDGEPVTVPLRSIVTASNAEMYIACCEAGLGLIQVPLFDIRDALADGRLTEVLTHMPAGTMPVAIVYAHRRKLTPRVRAFVDWMADLVRTSLRSPQPFLPPARDLPFER